MTTESAVLCIFTRLRRSQPFPPSCRPRAVRGAEQFFVNDRMTWLACTTGEELPVCAFDADDLPGPIGFLLWSDDPSAHTQTLGRPRAVMWCRAGLTLRIFVLDGVGLYRRTLEELGSQADASWPARSGARSPATWPSASARRSR
ncbi:hypothetical protein [Streptomyces badius]|uniref:Uncharacterized protein n=1 Tax=Streptomyces badius TaxID=1941 RepID=A0ABQ2TNY1_STRBA|nr:hypothetical protein [Streptomyces badius]GGS81787.1 hypothetical protein GCM10010253_65590 [Streptomyces badius]